jgi:hypothetical protein
MYFSVKKSVLLFCVKVVFTLLLFFSISNSLNARSFDLVFQVRTKTPIQIDDCSMSKIEKKALSKAEKRKNRKRSKQKSKKWSKF